MQTARGRRFQHGRGRPAPFRCPRRLDVNPSHRFALLSRVALVAAVAFLTVPAARAGEGDGAAGRSDAESRLAKIDKTDAAAAYRLGLDLTAKGYADLAAKAYEIVVGLEPDHLA